MRIFQETEAEAVAAILRNDGVVAVPTDTVYGVCARMDHRQAQEKLRDVKKRPPEKAFPLMCCDADQLRTVCETDERSEKLIRRLMPGPVTLVLKRRKEVPGFVSGDLPTAAVRLAPTEVLAKIIRLTGVPLYMTSANRSGEPVCTDLAGIEKACPLLDGMLAGTPSFNAASTIIDCSGAEIRILREGPVSMRDIERILEEEENDR